MARASKPGVATKVSGISTFAAGDCNSFDTAIDNIIDDYLSQTDPSTQAIASDLNFAAGKRIKQDFIYLNPSSAPATTEGHLYHNSTSHLPVFRNASEWRTLASYTSGTPSATTFLRGDGAWANKTLPGNVDYVVDYSGGYYRAIDVNGTETSAADIGGLLNDIIAAYKHIYIACTGALTVDEKVLVNANYVRLSASSWASILTAKNGLNDHVIEVTGDNCTLEDFGTDGQSANQSGTCHGIYNHGNNTTLNRLDVTDCLLDGIHNGDATWNSNTMGGWMNDGRITNCLRYGLYHDYTATDWQIEGPLIHDCVAGLVVDACSCRISKFHLWGNENNLLLAPAHNVSRINFVNMGFMDNHTSHNVSKDSSKTLDSCVFSGCNFWGKLTSGSAVRDLIYVSSSGNIWGNVISGCAFHGDNEAGTNQAQYGVNASGSNFADNTIVGNTFKGFTTAAPLNVDWIENAIDHNSFRDNAP